MDCKEPRRRSSAVAGISMTFAFYLVPGFGQPVHDHSKMAGHDMEAMSSMDHGMQMNEAGMYLMNMASGTGMNPQSWPMPMLASKAGSWNLMFMGQAYLIDTQQSGPRGGDKLYAPNWFMGAAEHAVGKGSFMFQTMLSLDPATITNRSYPMLFQTGETAYGKPLIDAQHPHDFLMTIGVHYAYPVAKDTMLQLYYAPVGDPFATQFTGIALPVKEKALQQAILEAVDALIADGTYRTLLAKWKLNDNGLEKATINAGQ